MKHLILVAAGLAMAGAASAQETDLSQFSENSEARSWNLGFEVPARFEATVVDMLCEVAGDCDNACADGRQLGLLRAVDGVLVYPNKNNQALFTGAAVDLQPFCGADVEVDGLMIDDPEIGSVNIYQVQMIRALDQEEFVTANAWVDTWEAANPEAAGEGRWYRRHPGIVAILADRGYLGNGMSWQEAWEITR